ncbi:enoyl-CoA hydratase/isomerase family protein [Ideonella sp. BN130291]|uniref:enoyl-CoA hydratase/isomerase family protein n=1 Tax=Ideonella sp. BN130291 TaxID=3112940 RepID=UPI002E25B7B5|nr:enoyl-CoA hydratase/isomerase family protein [Ideonella sp. BN130291]
MQVRIEHRGAFVFATLDAPATRNALTDEMVQALASALQQAQARPEVRALVVSGANGSFCAGGDFSAFKALLAKPPPVGEPDPIIGFNRAFGTLLERLSDADIATIAVVEGAAMGGGVGLAACCDVVLAASTAQFAMPELTLGLPPAQIAPFVAERIGHAAALRLMFTGQRLTGEQAHAAGLVDEVLWPDALQPRLLAWLSDLERAEPGALRATKAVLRQARTGPRTQALDGAAQAFAHCLRSGTAAEGLAAFAARRPPRWASGEGA